MDGALGLLLQPTATETAEACNQRFAGGWRSAGLLIKQNDKQQKHENKNNRTPAHR